VNNDNLEIISAAAKVISESTDGNRHGTKISNERVLQFIDAEALSIDDYEPLRKQSPGDRYITKWKRKADGIGVAFREIKGCGSNDADSDNFKLIRREVTILRMLATHPDVVIFHGIANGGAKRWLVTEWPTHGSLFNYYESFSETFSLDWSKRIKFAFQISRALAYIHSAGILHHDVRSDNVIITNHEQAKLANFGLSRFVRDSTKNVSRLREQVRYMAPEKLEDEKHRYDFKCEVYRYVA
jgi:serine/threonine protein kinase